MSHGEERRGCHFRAGRGQNGSDDVPTCRCDLTGLQSSLPQTPFHAALHLAWPPSCPAWFRKSAYGRVSHIGRPPPTTPPFPASPTTHSARPPVPGTHMCVHQTHMHSLSYYPSPLLHAPPPASLPPCRAHTFGMRQHTRSQPPAGRKAPSAATTAASRYPIMHMRPAPPLPHPLLHPVLHAAASQSTCMHRVRVPSSWPLSQRSVMPSPMTCTRSGCSTVAAAPGVPG